MVITVTTTKQEYYNHKLSNLTYFVLLWSKYRLLLKQLFANTIYLLINLNFLDLIQRLGVSLNATFHELVVPTRGNKSRV